MHFRSPSFAALPLQGAYSCGFSGRNLRDFLYSTALFSSTCVPFVDKDLFGAEPFDPFTCGAADFPPDIQSKLDEMQVSPRLPASDPSSSYTSSLSVIWLWSP